MALIMQNDCILLLYDYYWSSVWYNELCEDLPNPRHQSLRPQSRELSAVDHQAPTPTCVSQPVYPGLPFTRLSVNFDAKHKLRLSKQASSGLEPPPTSSDCVAPVWGTPGVGMRGEGNGLNCEMMDLDRDGSSGSLTTLNLSNDEKSWHKIDGIMVLYWRLFNKAGLGI